MWHTYNFVGIGRVQQEGNNSLQPIYVHAPLLEQYCSCHAHSRVVCCSGLELVSVRLKTC